MPAISRIRITNLVYENGAKRYGDEVFHFDSHNGVFLLENGGGKTVLVQAILQAILPHTPLANRRAKDTFALENGPAHLAIEWIVNERPRRYALTAITLFSSREGIDSYKYVYEYEAGDENSLAGLPFVYQGPDGRLRAASKEEIYDYYQRMSRNYMNAHFFAKHREYQKYIEENLKIIISEWRSIARINSAEGEIEGFFEGCRTTSQLVDQLLIPTVEEAMAGDGTRDFVEMFERHRDHFKKHRQLRDQIAENQRVESEVGRYVDTFSLYETVHQSLLVEKGKAKVLHQLAKKQEEELEQRLQENEQAGAILFRQRKEWEHRQASLKLARLEQELEQAQARYQQVRDEHDAWQQDFERSDRRLQNLEIAKLETGIRVRQEEIEHYTHQLETLAMEQDVQELERQINENASHLRYCYAQEEAELEDRRREIRARQGQIGAELTRLEALLKRKHGEHRDLEVKKAQASERETRAEKDMAEIASQVLANPRHDDLLQEKRKWEARTVELERDRQENQALERQLTEEKQRLKQELPRLRRQYEEHARVEQRLKLELERIDEEHQSLLRSLHELRTELYSVNSIYLNQERVRENLEDGVETLRRSREQALTKESQARAIYALYEPSNYYAADPRVEQWIEEWREQYSYLEAGTIYVQKAVGQLGGSEADFFRSYPFWAITVVCLAPEADRLLSRMKRVAGELTHPIFIISQEEARRLIEGREDGSAEGWPLARQIFPASWEINLSPEAFRNWKQEMERVAGEAKSGREIEEAKLQALEHFFDRFRGFLECYTFEEYRRLQAAWKENREQTVVLDQVIRGRDSRLAEVDECLTQLHHNLLLINEEHTILSNQIRQAQTYIRREVERDQARLDLQQYEELLATKSQDIEVLESQRSIEEERQQREQAAMYALDADLKHLRQDELYQEVQSVTPQDTSFSRSRLEIERRSLLEDRRQKQKNREVIEERLSLARSSQQDMQDDLRRQRQRCEYEIEEGLLFPPGGEEEIDRLAKTTREFKRQLTKLTPQLSRTQKEHVVAEDRFNRLQEEFFKDYSERAAFTVGLRQVEEELSKEQDELNLQGRHLTMQAEKLRVEKGSIDQAFNELERKDGRYEFLRDDIDEVELPPAVVQDFAYQRLRVIANLMERLEEKQAALGRQADELTSERHRMERFCQDQVRDVKLREGVIAGLKFRDNYEEVLQWKAQLGERIARAIRHAEDDLREHDRELQQFINHLHSYLVTMAGELRIIPRKTRVKVGEAWRDIFIFEVPEWDEKEGKSELRRHVDWMINQIESHHYRDENGQENYAQVRSDVEKWLKSQQLLSNVMKGRTIKVKCRKVTGDGRVISQPNSWESSNQWSGGEKWSKNMALFLGILNYLAEKRQAIDPHSKRSRTVILDNPFGKASSDHVLDPVFFIAEQLGFQIIALTALAEGKFIRDYFPIVYSCRLRPTASVDKYLVQAEREIRYAYFQDHAPEALQRLGEQRQMGLF